MGRRRVEIVLVKSPEISAAVGTYARARSRLTVTPAVVSKRKECFVLMTGPVMIAQTGSDETVKVFRARPVPLAARGCTNIEAIAASKASLRTYQRPNRESCCLLTLTPCSSPRP